MSSAATADRLDSTPGEEDKLSDRDIKLVQRYLSDPTVFPKEFKRWITEHSSDTVDIAKTQVHGLVNNSGQIMIGNASMGILGATLAGVVVPYAAVAAPEGWLLCDGHEVDRVEYATLFGLLGTTWGIPSIAALFKLPDLRGRAPFGVDSNVGFAASDGAAAGGRGPKHKHWFIDTPSFNASGGTSYGGSHAHTYRRHTESGGQGGTAGGTVGLAGGFDASTTDNGGHDHGVSVSGSVQVNGYAGTGPLDDVVGWVGLNYIIGSGKVP